MYLLLDNNRPFAVLSEISNLDIAIKEEFSLEKIEKVSFSIPDWGEEKQLTVLAYSEDSPEEIIQYDLDIQKIVNY